MRLSLLPVLDAARGADAAHTAELDRLRAENAALHARLASPAVVRSTASRGAARSSVRTGPCDQWTPLLAAYPWPVSEAARVMKCESGCNPDARNPSGANGLMQVMHGPMDPAANIATAYSMWSRSGWRPWVCKP